MFETQEFGHHRLLAEDLPLVDEAYRRVLALKTLPVGNGPAVRDAIVAELRGGRRDLHGLCKAGRRAGLTPR